MLAQYIKPSLTNASAAFSIFWLVLLVFIFGTLFTLTGLLISQLVFPVSMEQALNMENYLDNPTVIQMLRFNQLMSALGIFVAPAVYFAYMKGKSPTRMYGIKPASISLIAYSILAVLLFIPLVSALHEWNQSLQLPQVFAALESYLKALEAQAETLTKAFLTTDSWGGLLYTLLIIAVIPALGEELLFRGALQTELQRWFRNGHLAVWLTAAIFSFIHFQFYGFLPRMFLGAVLGYLYLYSNNLWLPIAGHFANNAFGVLWFQLEDMGTVPSEKESGIFDSWQGLLITLVLSFAAFLIIRKIKIEQEKSRYLTYGG